MKVLLVCHQPPPDHGAARVGERVDRVLRAAGADVRTVPIQTSRTLGEVGRASAGKLARTAALGASVARAWMAQRPDVIYWSASSHGLGLWRDVALARLGGRRLFHFHTLGARRWRGRSRPRRALLRRHLAGAELLLLGPRHIEDFAGLGPLRTHVVPNGVPDPGVDVEVVFRERRGPPRLLFLGNLHPAKGWWDALELARRTPNLHLDLAGAWWRGSDRAAFASFVGRHRLGARVRHHGFVGGAEKDALLRRASALVLPSRDDAAPLVVLEALAYGLPVLATRVGLVPDLVCERTAVLVDSVAELPRALERMRGTHMDLETARACRARYLGRFTEARFESALREAVGI